MQLFGTKGQQDNGTSSKSCYGIGRDGTGRDNCCFRTYFSCFRASFPVYNVLFSFRTSFCCFRMSFFCFLVFMGKVIGTSQDRGVCPWIFPPALVPGQRDNGTRTYFCPGTKGQWDISTGIVPRRPAGHLVPWNP